MQELNRRQVLKAGGTLGAVAAASPMAMAAKTDAATKADTKGMNRVRQKLVDPPLAPDYDQNYSGSAKIVEVELTVHEEKRVTYEEGGRTVSRKNRGVRILRGEHRSPMPGFVRDIGSGGCSVGPMPGNFGFRVVRES